jgi:hypothetical protein
MAAGVSKANSIDGGNTCVIKCMIKLSEADLHMNSQVGRETPPIIDATSFPTLSVVAD